MIITSSKLISCDRKNSIIDNGALVLRNGAIAAVGSKNNITKRFRGHRIVHIPDAVLMPGLINVHAHLELPALLDDIETTSFTDWVLNLIQAKKSLHAGDYRYAAKTNIDALIQSGTTTVGETCTHDISPEYLKKSGLRTYIFFEVISMASHQSNHKAKIPSHKASAPLLIRFGVSPHSPYTVSESVLLKIKSTASLKQMRMSMHIAESKDEIKLLQQKKSGLQKLYQFAHWDLDWAPKSASPFAYLNTLGILSPRLLAVHCVQTTVADIALIKQSHTTVAHCPRSNKALGVGRMPLKKLMSAGIAVGLGTDSLASVPNLNMWDEMRYAYRIHRSDGVTAQDIFRLATTGGAQALGMGKMTGALESGKRADIIAVPFPAKNTGDIYSDLLRETKSCIMTMVDGKILYQK